MNTDKKILTPFFKILISILIIGILFKVQHWPFANGLLLIAYSLIGLLYPIRFFYKKRKRLIDYIKLILIMSWSLDGVFFTLHLPYRNWVEILVGASFLLWVILELINFFRQFNNLGSAKEKLVILKELRPKTIFEIAGLVTFLGAIFKIQHWPYGLVLLIVGLSLVCVGLLKDLFVREK